MKEELTRKPMERWGERPQGRGVVTVENVGWKMYRGGEGKKEDGRHAEASRNQITERGFYPSDK